MSRAACHKFEVKDPGLGEGEQNVILELQSWRAAYLLGADLRPWLTGSDGLRLPSLAATTDNSPGQAATTSNDHCIAPTKPQSIDAWQKPSPRGLAAMCGIQSNGNKLYLEHRRAG